MYNTYTKQYINNIPNIYQKYIKVCTNFKKKYIYVSKICKVNTKYQAAAGPARPGRAGPGRAGGRLVFCIYLVYVGYIHIHIYIYTCIYFVFPYVFWYICWYIVWLIFYPELVSSS